MAVDTTLVVQVTETGLTDKSFFTHNLNKVVRLAQVADRGKTLFYNEKYGALKMLQSHSLLFANSVVYTEIEDVNISIDAAINVRCEKRFLRKNMARS